MSILQTTTGSAAKLYVNALESAYKHWIEVYDPDYGLAQDPDVYALLRRDPETAHAMTYRRQLVAGTRYRIVPASDSDADRRAATIVEQLFKKIRNFTAARFGLADAVFRGSAWTRIVGSFQTMKMPGSAEARLWWCPTRLVNVDKRRFRQGHLDRNEPVRWELYSVERGQWEPLGQERRNFVRVAYDQDEESLGHGRGLVEAIYQYQYAKAKVLAEGLEGLERWAQGVIEAEVDDERLGGKNLSTNREAAAEWLSVFDKMRARHSLVHRKGDKVTMLDGPAVGHEMVMDFLTYLANGIRLVVLGANLPTSANSGGSYALAEVQENSTEATVDYDRDQQDEGINHDLMPRVWSLNRANLIAEGLEDAEMPRYEIASRMRRDPATTAMAVATLINAGVRGLREDEVMDVLGFTPARPHDRVLQVVQPAGAAPVETPEQAGPEDPTESPPL
jgi:hypothetical protein